MPKHTLQGYANITHGRSAKLFEQKRLFSSDPKPEVVEYVLPHRQFPEQKQLPKEWYDISERMKRYLHAHLCVESDSVQK